MGICGCRVPSFSRTRLDYTLLPFPLRRISQSHPIINSLTYHVTLLRWLL